MTRIEIASELMREERFGDVLAVLDEKEIDTDEVCVRACALLQLDRPKEAANALISFFLSSNRILSAQERLSVFRVLADAARQAGDEVLCKLITDRDSDCSVGERDRAEFVIKAFYLGGGLKRPPAADIVLQKERELKELRTTPHTNPEDSYLLFLKRFSSFTPVLRNELADYRLGGGYLLVSKGYGLVIDPGHDFVANLYSDELSVEDVNGIVITHSHDDHCADLPALLALLYQRHHKSPRIDLYADEITLKNFEPILKRSTYLRCIKTLSSESDDTITSAGIRVRGLPTQHDTWGSLDKGVGLLLDLPYAKTTILITGDTGWTPALSNVYAQINAQTKKILVAHVSSVHRPEAATLLTGKEPPDFYQQHLCLHGLCKSIEAFTPTMVVISEVGEELKQEVGYLADLVKRTYKPENGCEVCDIGCRVYLRPELRWMPSQPQSNEDGVSTAPVA